LQLEAGRCVTPVTGHLSIHPPTNSSRRLRQAALYLARSREDRVTIRRRADVVAFMRF
jgi:hypothetical protein